MGGSWAVTGSLASLVSLLAASWAALGWSLRRLGRLLNGSWTRLSTKLGRLGGLGSVFEASWSDFRTKMEPSSYQNLLDHGSSVEIA